MKSETNFCISLKLSSSILEWNRTQKLCILITKNFFYLVLIFGYDCFHINLALSVFKFPMTAYIVAGTQAPPGKQNLVIVMKMSQLDKTSPSDDESKLIQVQI